MAGSRPCFELFFLLDRLERPLSDGMREFAARRPLLTHACRLAAHTGDAIFHLLVWSVLYGRAHPSDRSWLRRWLGTTLVAIGLLYPLRALTRRRRPIGELPAEFITTPVQDGWSFPSGHALRNSILALQVGHRYPGLRPLLALHLAVVCLARLLLGLHWPSDILAGLLLGSWLGKGRSGKKGGRKS